MSARPENRSEELSSNADPGSGQAHGRAAVATLLIRRRRVVRDRILRGLRRAGGPLADLEDIEASVFRRIDLAMLRGMVRTENEREFWAYVLAVVDNAVLTRLREASRDRAARGRWAEGVGTLPSRFRDCQSDDDAAARLHEVILSLDREEDRELLWARLRGWTYDELAEQRGCPPERLRARFVSICRRLQGRSPHFTPPPTAAVTCGEGAERPGRVTSARLPGAAGAPRAASSRRGRWPCPRARGRPG